jgi:hypothetical protein
MATSPGLASMSIWMALLLGACGGGGDGDSGDQATPIPGAAAGGIWRGTLSTSAGASISVEGVVTEDGRLGLLDGNGMLYVGRFGMSGQNAVARIDGARLATVPSNIAPPTHGSGEISVSIIERTSLDGLLSFDPEEGPRIGGSLSLDFQPLYNRPSSLATVAGNYVLSTIPTESVFTVDSLGRVFHQTTNGLTCTGNGQMSVIDSRFNVYEFSLTYDCGAGELEELGLAVLDDTTQPETLIIYEHFPERGFIPMLVSYSRYQRI